VVIEVELASPDRAQSLAGRTGVELAGPRTVRSEGATFWEAWDALWGPV
jgi:hypothetical protein